MTGTNELQINMPLRLRDGAERVIARVKELARAVPDAQMLIRSISEAFHFNQM